MSDCIELVVGKAQPTGTETTPDTIIAITSRIPEVDTWTDLAKWDAYCDGQAIYLEEALITALPGGVYDRLLGRMLARKASHFGIAHKQ